MDSSEDDVSVLDLSYEEDDNYKDELNDIIEEWKGYERALEGVEKDGFQKMKDYAKSHVRAGKDQNRSKEIETFFISILLEQQLEIDRLEKRLEGQKEVDERY